MQTLFRTETSPDLHKLADALQSSPAELQCNGEPVEVLWFQIHQVNDQTTKVVLIWNYK